ncbi:sensor histidine kinase [Clostridium haemolyticum]|uniref:histidine kinase n=1 Tax=Clostridium haemolyticum NCTC 9693 TaxID=1443114 RepID=A0ABR4TBQ0_CLOHA|nr:HAMP domain-containing sensor histidine kinase [Clostridium haemolyticum]KEI14799.1 lantibiotic biosynthesis protein [Clostridium haemolyticum NCTC 9693]KGN04654.1 lantibiotic biosynthesis protein [Clostridium haemolyticum NCTC 8350]
MERIKGEKSISKIFAIYVVLFCTVTIIVAIISLRLCIIGLNKGFILPANYYERKIENRRSEIAKAKDVKKLIPEECNYAVYDLNGKILKTNVSQDKALDMWDVLKNNEMSNGRYFYKIIQRNNGICVVEYNFNVSFANPTLRKYIKNIEVASLIVLFILFVIQIIIFSKCFKKRLKKEMKILKDITENIQMENLEFKVNHSNIVEINDVINALDKMKTKLSESLTKQWNMEETRKEQIGALAHDIKTPLTIIRGNSELLGELDLNVEQTKFNDGNLNEIKNMEYYIKCLIEITKAEKEAVVQKRQINLMDFIDDITKSASFIGKNKNFTFESQIKNIPEFIFVDEIALKRVINNIISNSVDYCMQNGEILLTVDSNYKSIQFIVEDSGKGFTKEEISFATEQFFQGDKSRNSKNHYGMGLYISKKLIEKHNGNIILQNSKTLGGAKVIIEVPI